MANTKKVKWLDGNRVSIRKPTSVKKITGTRLASVLGFNQYSTPFMAWCEITKTYQEPFEGNIYTEAGNIIEPKVQQYLKDLYFDDLVIPEDIWGKDPFKKTFGNFFEHEYLGGMWDAKVPSIKTMVEIKTTSSPQNWLEGAPIFQAIQGALYAYLEGWEDVIMVGVFLSPNDLENPDDFVPSAENVTLDAFNLYERFPRWDEWMDRVNTMYTENILTGLSPAYDESHKGDLEFIKALRTVSPKPDDEMAERLVEIQGLLEAIATLDAEKKPLADRLKALETGLRDYLTAEIEKNPATEYATLGLDNEELVYTLSKSTKTRINTEALEIDGLLEKYSVEETSYTLRKKLMKEEE